MAKTNSPLALRKAAVEAIDKCLGGSPTTKAVKGILVSLVILARNPGIDHCPECGTTMWPLLAHPSRCIVAGMLIEE